MLDPAIHERGWTKDLIRREVTAGPVDAIEGKARLSSLCTVNYALRVRVNVETHPVALALMKVKGRKIAEGMKGPIVAAVADRTGVRI